MNDEQFQASMTLVEKGTLLYFKEIVCKLLDNEKKLQLQEYVTVF